jgi:hypothetical protein
MQITVSIALAKSESLKKTSDETAADIIKACGGKEDTDFCTVQVSQPEPGSAGTPPPPPEPFFVQPGPPPTGG